MTRLGQPPDDADLAEAEENRRLAAQLQGPGLTPLGRLGTPPGAETIREADVPASLSSTAADIEGGEQVLAQVGRVIPPGFRFEHYCKIALTVAGTVFGAVVAVVDPSLLPLASVISGGSLTGFGVEIHTHGKGP